MPWNWKRQENPQTTADEKQRKHIERVAYELYQNRILLNRLGNAQSDWEIATKIVKSSWHTTLFASHRPLIQLEKRVWEPLLVWANNQALLSLLGVIGNVGLIIAVITYVASEKQRRDAEVLNAWQTLTSAHGQAGSGGRIQALEFLNASPGANWRRKFPWFCAPHPVCVWSRESLAGIDLSVELSDLAGDDTKNSSTELSDLKLLSLLPSTGDATKSGATEFSNIDIIRSKHSSKYRYKFQTSETPRIVYLKGIHLPKADLENANLQHADLKEANLRDTDLEKANLRDTDLEKANLQGAFLWKANLQGTNLKDANLQGTNLKDANLQDANLRDANLQDANLWGANLQDANLWGANLQYTTLRDVNLEGADLRNVNLEGADLRNVNLEGADLENANLQGADLENANLQGAFLWRANLQRAFLRGANLQDTHLEDANLQGSLLWEANLQGANLRDVDLQNSIFLATDLRDARNLSLGTLNSSNLPLLCNSSFSEGIEIKGGKNRDCDQIASVLLNAYPIRLSSLEEAKTFIKEWQQKIWD